MENKVQFYQDKSSEWRWRIVAQNGNTLADSGEGYKNHQDCINGFKLVADTMGILKQGVEQAGPTGYQLQ